MKNVIVVVGGILVTYRTAQKRMTHHKKTKSPLIIASPKNIFKKTKNKNSRISYLVLSLQARESLTFDR